MRPWQWVALALIGLSWWAERHPPTYGTPLRASPVPLLPSGAPSRPSWGNPGDWELWGSGSRSDPFVWANLATGEYV